MRPVAPHSVLTVALFFYKLLLYSVISSYQTKWELSIIKKTRTVSGRIGLSGGKEIPNILGVELLLLLQDFEFVLDVVFTVGDP